MMLKLKDIISDSGARSAVFASFNGIVNCLKASFGFFLFREEGRTASCLSNANASNARFLLGKKDKKGMNIRNGFR